LRETVEKNPLDDFHFIQYMSLLSRIPALSKLGPAFLSLLPNAMLPHPHSVSISPPTSLLYILHWN
jgi:hypothetical protein